MKISILLVLMFLQSCAVGQLSQMDREDRDGGRVSKLFTGHSEEEKQADMLAKIKAKCPDGHEIVSKGKTPKNFGHWNYEADYIDFKCKISTRDTASK